MCCFWFTKKQTRSQKAAPKYKPQYVLPETFPPFFHDFH